MSNIYNQSDLEMLVRDCLTRAGVSDGVAQIVARDVALSEAAGDSDNGFSALLRDIRLIRYGRLHPDAEVTITCPAPAVIRVDAGHGFGAAALVQGVPELIKATKAQGVAMLHLSRSSDAGLMAGAMADLAAAGVAGLSVKPDGGVVAIQPGARLSARLDTGARSMLQDLLSLAPPVEDSPLGGPVAHASWLTAVDPVATGAEALFAQLPAAEIASCAGGIAVAPELLAQIVNA